MTMRSFLVLVITGSWLLMAGQASALGGHDGPYHPPSVTVPRPGNNKNSLPKAGRPAKVPQKSMTVARPRRPAASSPAKAHGAWLRPVSDKSWVRRDHSRVGAPSSETLLHPNSRLPRVEARHE